MKALKATLKIVLPSVDEITEGLSPKHVNPRLAAAEEAHTRAVDALEKAREELAGWERRAEGLPAQVRAGRASMADLEAALLKRDAAALAIGAFELAEAESFDLVKREQERSEGLVEMEVAKRQAILQEVIDQVSPVLDALRERENALARASTDKWGIVGLGLEWPRPLVDDIAEACNRQNVWAEQRQREREEWEKQRAETHWLTGNGARG